MRRSLLIDCASKEVSKQSVMSSRSMKAFPGSMPFMPELDDGVVGVAMDVDVDGDALELLGNAAVDHKLTDADLFNDFQDDFDDTDLVGAPGV